MKTWLFDFDGTLVDSMPVYAAAMLRILDENQISYGDDIVKIITPLGYWGTARYFVSLGVPMTVEETVERITEYLVEAYTHIVPAKEHVIEVLRKLKERGDDLNVLTASPHIALDPCLKRLGIYDLFSHIWSCEDFHTTKADPEIYRMAAKEIGRPVGEIWFLDDNLNADQTAREAGILVCGVYDDSSADVEEEIRTVAHRYMRDFTELLTF